LILMETSLIWVVNESTIQRKIYEMYQI